VGRLVSVYQAAGGGAEAEEAGLEQRLADLCARGRAAHPALGLDDEVFVAHLARSGAAVDDVFSTLHAEDLYLARACLARNGAAIAQLREAYRPVIARYLKRVGHSASIVEEVEQQLWDAVFVGGDAGPKLASYAGRGPLGGWLGISAQRIALMTLRHEQAENRARNEVAARGRLVAEDPQLAAIKQRYRAQFQDAVDAAIATLDDRDKTLYRMHLVDGLTLESIAKVYGVTHPTIMRWLDRARLRLLDEAKRRLREALAVSSNEFDSIARLLISQLELDISLALAKAP
jgi:RNA polymerase sigma-70 factor (ECF subfamily)